MQPATGVADARDQLPFDEAVHVLVGAADPCRIASALLENRGQPCRESDAPSSLRQRAARHQRFGPREAAGHVVFEEPAIERERDAEIEGRRIGRGIEPSGPEVAAPIGDFRLADF